MNYIRNETSLLFLQSDLINNNSLLNLKIYIANLSAYSPITDQLTSFELFEFIWRLAIGLIAGIFNSISIFTFLISFCMNYSAKGFELISYMNIASLLNVISHLILFKPENVILNPSEETRCRLQGPLMVYSELAQFLTATTLSYSIYKDILEGSNRMGRKERVVKLFICFLVPLILIGIGVYKGVFGENGHWCWISIEFGKNIGVVYYIVIWIFMLFNITLIFLANKKVKTHRRMNTKPEEEIDEERTLVKRMSVFPILLIICWIFTTIDRLGIRLDSIHDIFEVINVSSILFLGIFISIFSFLFIFGTNCKAFCNLFREFCASVCKKNQRSETERSSLLISD